MTPEPAEALVERVREGLMHERPNYATGRAALTELAERVKAAEAERDRHIERGDKLLAGYTKTQEQAAELVEALHAASLLTGMVHDPALTFTEARRTLRQIEVDTQRALAKVRGEAEPPGWGADRKCPETCG